MSKFIVDDILDNADPLLFEELAELMGLMEISEEEKKQIESSPINIDSALEKVRNFERRQRRKEAKGNTKARKITSEITSEETQEMTKEKTRLKPRRIIISDAAKAASLVVTDMNKQDKLQVLHSRQHKKNKSKSSGK